MSDFRVLIVDDDENDRLMLRLAITSALGDEGLVQEVPNGAEAIDYLRGAGAYADRSTYPFPTLILLDLKMPRADGLAVLEFLSHNPGWSVIPRIVFTGSEDEDDIKKAYLLGASAYHVKPMGGDELLRLAKLIITYWASSRVPPVDASGKLLWTNSSGKLGERIAQPRSGDTMTP